MSTDAALDASGLGLRRRTMDYLLQALLAGMVAFVLTWGGYVWVLSTQAEKKNIEQDGRLNSFEKKLDGIDSKLDRLLERK